MKNYRTTIIGAMLAGASWISIYQSNGGDLADWRQWVIPALVAVLGYLAKDAGVSGTLKALFLSGAVLTLPSCANTEKNQRIGSLVSLAVDAAEKRGIITSADAADIRAAKAIILPAVAASAVDAASGK